METKTRILVVDDDAENLRFVGAILGSLGYEVVLAGCGAEALSRIREAVPKVILLDAVMPEIDGLDVVKRLRDDETTKAIPIIVMTARLETEERQKALAVGVDEFLTKPVDETELQTRVSSLVKVKTYADHMRNYKQDLEKEVAKRTQEFSQALERIKVTSLDTVYRLSRAAEYKDEDTGAHVQRMSHYSSAIARSLGLDDQFVEHVLWAAPMHDIGKIGIPDRVLLKPGKLDDEEWIIMRRHTTIGAEILKDADADFIKLAANIALSHHEKWAGGGYPQGLKGTDIPMAARIVSVADAFDAMMSERPYKAPFPLEKAFALIKEDRGTRFDPQVVDAFFNVDTEIIAGLNWWKFMASDPASEKSDLSDLFK